MKTYLRVYFAEKYKAVLEEFPWPELTAHSVVVRNDYTVISAGTERANLLGLPNTSGSFPFYAGYSGAGTVLETGAEVKSVQPGDRVAVVWGGHCSHSFVGEENVIRIEDASINTMDAAFAHICSFPMLGLRKLRVEMGESLMVAGQGLLGTLAVQLGNLCGAIPVLSADLDPQRRQLSCQLGATASFDPAAENYVSGVLEATGGAGVNAVVEVTGSAKALQQALEYVAFEGRIVLLGCTRISDVPIDFYKYVHKRGIALIGANTYARPKLESRPGEWTTRDDCRAFLKFMAAGKIRVHELISGVISPQQAPDTYAMLAENANPPLGFVLNWKDTMRQ